MAQGIGIYQLPEADTLSGTESIPIDTGADTKRATVAKIREGLLSEDGDASQAVMTPDGGTTERTLAGRGGDRITARDLGAVGDGISDDRAALLAADALGGDVILPKGTYLVGSTVTISGRVRFARGAKIKASGAVTIILAGGIDAPLSQVFDLSGGAVVEFSGSQSEGRPEWWGCKRNDNTTLAANFSAIQACIAACPVTLLQAADYYVSDTVRIATSYRTLAGVKGVWTGVGTATRLIVSSATAHALEIGPAVDPVDTRGFLKNVRVQDIEVGRSLNPIGNPCGVRLIKSLYTELSDVYSAEHGFGFYMSGCVATDIVRCKAHRSVPGGNPGADIYYGFYQDGTVNIGLAGGNASTRYFDTHVTFSAAANVSFSAGYYLAQGGVDTFMLRPEAGSVGTGLYVTGLAGGTEAQQRVRDCNIQIVGPVLDTFTSYGLRLSNLGNGAAVSVIGGYAAPAAGSGALYGIQIDGSAGLVQIEGFQVIGHPVSTLVGLNVQNSSGVKSSCMLLDCLVGVVYSGATGCDSRDQICNTIVSSTTAAFWVQSASPSTGNKVAPSISATSALLARGIYLAGGSGTTTHTGNSIDCAGIDASSLTGAKLTIGGAAVVKDGVTLGNCVTGLATGNWTTTGTVVVGGATPPTAGQLNVVGAAGGVALALSDNATSSLYIRTASGGAVIGTDGGGSLKFAAGGNAAGDAKLTLAASGTLTHSAGPVVVDGNGLLGLRPYTVATLPSATAQRLIYVSDGAGSKRLAVSDGASWRWPDGVVVS